jgi:hypothetical protein
MKCRLDEVKPCRLAPWAQRGAGLRPVAKVPVPIGADTTIVG